jgi:hypothetical protein
MNHIIGTKEIWKAIKRVPRGISVHYPACGTMFQDRPTARVYPVFKTNSDSFPILRQ